MYSLLLFPKLRPIEKKFSYNYLESLIVISQDLKNDFQLHMNFVFLIQDTYC